MRIALFQSRTGIDPARNASALEAAMAEASAGGAAMLFTPEMSGVLNRDRAAGRSRIAREEDDEVLRRVRDAAARHRIWVHLGSLALLGGEDGRLRNRSFLIDDAGKVRARYDKMHLFDVDLASGESWRESASYAPGAGAVVADSPLGPLGLAICYDMRFPDLFSRLSEAGAVAFAIPSAFTVPTGEAHWHVLLRARAIEAGAFVVAAAQAGRHEDGRETYGHSLVVGPWGEVLLDMGTEEGVGFAELDMAQVAEVRTRLPVLAHRRSIGPAERAA